MHKFLRNASLLLIVQATAHAEVDCSALLSGVEGTARSAQNSLLVAQARQEPADLNATIARLRTQVNVLSERCGSVKAEDNAASSTDGSERSFSDFLPDFGAPSNSNAPKRPNAAQRSH